MRSGGQGSGRAASDRGLDGRSCRQCRHFEDDPERLERLLKGVLILSSTYGSARGDAGICNLQEIFLNPGPACGDFQPRSLAVGVPRS